MPLLGPDGEPAKSAAKPEMEHQDAPVTGDETVEHLPIIALTAFVVYKTPEGDTVSHYDVEGVVKQLTIVRQPAQDEVKGMCANVIDDINDLRTAAQLQDVGQAIVQSTTASVMANLQNAGRQAAEAQQAEAIRRQINL